MSIRNLIDIIDSVGKQADPVLTEAADYLGMFNDVFKTLKTMQANGVSVNVDQQIEEISEKVNEFRRMFKKNDRIVWAIRYYKLAYLAYVSDRIGNQPGWSPFVTLYQKNLAASGVKASLNALITMYRSMTVFTDIEHYLSLGIAQINNYVFTTADTPSELLYKFGQIERKWTENRNSHIPYDPSDGEIIMKFPDGFMWVDLKREGCEIEGNAMGHCGNSHARGTGATVLSLRKIVKEGGKTMVRPSLTFILHKDGYLGEMKGRANNKPDPKYHSHIVALLRLPMIKGISGGGYLPQNNFELKDLDDETRMKLVAEKPTLGSPSDLYKLFGVNETTVEATKKYWINALQQSMHNWRGFINDGKYFVLKEFKDFVDLIDDHGNRDAKYIINVIDGTNYVEYDNGEDTTTAAKEMYDDLPKDMNVKIAEYVKATYTDEVASWEEENDTEFDWQEGDAIIEILENEGDDLFETLWQGREAGYRTGAEREMIKSLESAITSIEGNDSPVSLHLVFDTDNENHTGLVWDTRCFVVTPTKEFMDNIVDCSSFEDQSSEEIFGETLDAIKVEVESPRYGWADYDRDAAIDYVSESSQIFN